MSTKNTSDSWEEYIQLQQMIDVMGKETASIFSYLCQLADEYEYDRVDTIDMFCEMFQAILDTLDIDEYDSEKENLLN